MSMSTWLSLLVLSFAARLETALLQIGILLA